MCGSMVDIQYATAEIRRAKKKKELEMWANAQRDGHPSEYIGGALRSTPQSLADAQYLTAVQ